MLSLQGVEGFGSVCAPTKADRAAEQAQQNAAREAARALLTPAQKAEITAAAKAAREELERTKGVITREHGTGLSPADRKLYDAAVKKAGRQAVIGSAVASWMRIGKLPFTTWKHATTGKKWGKYYHEGTKSLTSKPVPPSKGALESAWDSTGGAMYDAAKELAKKAWEQTCKITGSGPARLGAQVAGSTPNPYAQAGAMAVNTINSMCPTEAGACVESSPRMGLYHKDRKVWLIFKPAGGGMSGAWQDAIDSVNPYNETKPPEGYLFDTTAPELPAGVQDGGTTRNPFYKKVWFWAALGGVAAASGGAYWYLKRPGH